MTWQAAKRLAERIEDKDGQVHALVGRHVTNGEERFVVHVTEVAASYSGDYPYTISR